MEATPRSDRKQSRGLISADVGGAISFTRLNLCRRPDVRPLADRPHDPTGLFWPHLFRKMLRLKSQL